MRTSKVKNIALLIAVIVFGICAHAQAISFTVGSGNYYVSVGDHDYLPYAYNSYPGGYQQPGLSFQSAMADYGTWTSVQPFGNVWRPYAAAGWRPYTQGHWAYTQYGPTWEGYEPWAWAGYHYGNWVFTQQAGWVWIPGYDWHPGRVAWAQGYNSLGWMPLPPAGYDYSRGNIGYIGPTNQFSYNDNDFSIGFGVGIGNNDYYSGGPYYDPRYRDLYYNQNYLNSAMNLWTFIDPSNFNNDNYADYYYGGDYTRDLFDRRLVRISTRPLDRVVVERIVRQPVRVEQVRVNETQVDGHRVRLVAIEGEEQNIRKNANRTVREVIAPAFAEKGRTFKAKQSKSQGALDKAFHQENESQQVQTVNSDELVREARQTEQKQEQRRTQIKQTKRDEVVRIEKEGKIREKNSPGQLKKEEDTRTRNSRVNPSNPAPPEKEPNDQINRQNDQNNRRNRQIDQTPEQQQQEQEKNNRKNRQVDQTPDQQQPDQEQEKRRNRPVDQAPDQQQQQPDQEREKRLRDENSNREPEADQNPNTRDESNVKSDQDNPDRNVDSNDQKKQSDNNKKKAKTKKSKKDKNNNPDQPPQN